MSTFSDVEALYGSVRGTWTKNQAHILAHVALLLIVFVLCGATVPQVTIPKLDAKQITDNEWFKVAKDTGLIYVLFVFPIVAVAAYAAVLGALGRMLVMVVMLVFPPSPRRNRFRLLSVSNLEPLALTLKRTDFELSDLINKSTEFVLKYQSKKSEAWDGYQKTIAGLTKDAQVYLADFLVFVLAWTILFRLTPQAAWVQANESRFWPVIIILLGLAWFAWFRVSHAIAAVQILQLVFVSAMVSIDPDMAPLLDLPQKDRDDVGRRLDELLQREQEVPDGRPSLRRFLASRLGFSPSTKKSDELRAGPGFPFRSIYRRGLRFSSDDSRRERYDNGQWFADYLAYLYYRFHIRLSHLARALSHLIRYLITGAP